MDGQQNIKICDAKQAKQVHQYKNTKTKLCKSNAAIWYNKTSRLYKNTRTCALSCLITKIILRCTVSKTSKYLTDALKQIILLSWLRVVSIRPNEIQAPLH